METTSERIRSLFDALGKTPDEVANRLRDLGIRGHRENSCLCPIARYLTINGITDVTVDGEYAEFGVENRTGAWPLPKSIADFVCMFDHGDYPNLIGEPS